MRTRSGRTSASLLLHSKEVSVNYRSNSFVVDAFEFTSRYDDRVAPFWFAKAVDNEKIFIDSRIEDGANRIYGFTLYSDRGRLKGRCGDYVVHLQTGEIGMMSKAMFQTLFRVNR